MFITFLKVSVRLSEIYYYYFIIYIYQFLSSICASGFFEFWVLPLKFVFFDFHPQHISVAINLLNFGFFIRLLITQVVERESRQRKGERWLARWTTDGGRRLTTLKTVVIVFLGHLKPDPPAVASRTKASYRRQQLRTEIAILCQGKTARPGTWLCGRYVKEWADWLSDELG
ncbi:hypothetical protein HanRHA438_Chr02g0093511 [Helianthus annuus]|uniref:Uncharacterized protein n=1 Tax=Helianthus annuus TaxID=4232 RepID=A0A251VJN7_HELAN|nr:hypothetical protein HanXRQr2_Chr02g0082181 [Helianthus annuus]KAJ0605952.1 hypothetical protein HanHA300_Chr02g0068731 [Helianthus annuus]KAJ0616868.1 hypothetical protein HanIR_Chr02g0095261 [Helianthus annuus]KAJ0619949.1 hypothetical protein HanHA89_Chr02g0076991 [Helianthus annuus]KAJ0778410.1 hypothetical protein HanLR1_Chr02g0071401 [Helianthus annuus]